jgi:tetraacyldisaccharide 4'-kinase
VDDIPIEAIKLADLRAQMSIVTQDVTLFNASIARNIAYGQLQDASVDAIRDAASRAYATGFIDALDDGLDTVVGDDGVLLSGGQRQRLAIARAFLKDAPILILDEATSALDSESERYIQRALDAVVKGRTTIVIAHRLSTIEKADRILVIDGGRIVEEGTHAELLARRGFYAALSAHSGMGEGGSATAGGRDVGRQRDVAAGQIQGTGTDDGLLVNAWYGDPSWPRLLAPLAYLFRQLSRYRRHWITSDPDRHWKAPVPVIVVGNITVGGTGKSPLVMWLAEQFGSHGIRAGIVSRGYGGSATQYPFAVDAHTDPRKAGDEAVMIRRRTGCPLVVAPDRVAAAKHLLAMHDCQVIISDDGLQHYALDRDVEIILIDAERGLGNGRCLPAGPLREAPARLREADYVVACGEGELSLEVATLPMRLAPTALVNVMTAERKSVNALRGSTIHAVAGIGNTDRFFAALRQLGYEIVAHRFPDHHRFDAADLTFADALPVVMTEKDAVKVRRLEPGSIHPDFWYLEVDVVMPADFMDGLMARVGLTRPSVDSG